jgi:hypothetical protein
MRSERPGAIFVFASMLLLLACTHRQPPEATRRHGQAAIPARDAILLGDLSAFRRAIAQLDADPPRGASADRVAWRGAVAAAVGASTLEEAARGLGRVGVACGGCHLGAAIAIPGPATATPQGDELWAEMARHDRALQLVWSGLIRPSQADLDAGAAAFRDSLFHPGGVDPAPQALALDEAVSVIAGTLPSAGADRGERFGDLLLACVACHASPAPGLQGEPR